MSEIEALAARASEVTTTLGTAELNRIAALTHRIAQDEVRRLGGILSPVLGRSYEELSSREREGMRSAVSHVVVALVLLGIIESPV
jgi:hypothetical protein